MKFSEITGQKDFVNTLLRLVEEKRVGHAILFHENDGFGALPAAIAFAQYLCCPNADGHDSCGNCPVCNKFRKLIHPDLHFVMPVTSTKEISSEKKPISDHFIGKWREMVISDPYFTEEEWYEYIGIENKSGIIGVNEASSIIKKLNLRSFEGGDKFMIIWLPERMNQEAANKLLKLTEEPPPGTYLFFISHAPEKVIKTILSRCQILRMEPIDRDSLADRISLRYGLEQEETLKWARISEGSLSRAKRLVEKSSQYGIFYEKLEILLEGCVGKDMRKVIAFWEDIASDHREKQRSFCRYVLEFLRMIWMVHIGMEEIADIPSSMKEIVAKWSARFQKGFYEKAYDMFNQAIMDIDRNVNAKYIFADIANRFYLSLRPNRGLIRKT